MCHFDPSKSARDQEKIPQIKKKGSRSLKNARDLGSAFDFDFFLILIKSNADQIENYHDL